MFTVDCVSPCCHDIKCVYQKAGISSCMTSRCTFLSLKCLVFFCFVFFECNRLQDKFALGPWRSHTCVPSSYATSSESDPFSLYRNNILHLLPNSIATFSPVQLWKGFFFFFSYVANRFLKVNVTCRLRLSFRKRLRFVSLSLSL